MLLIQVIKYSASDCVFSVFWTSCSSHCSPTVAFWGKTSFWYHHSCVHSVHLFSLYTFWMSWQIIMIICSSYNYWFFNSATYLQLVVVIRGRQLGGGGVLLSNCCLLTWLEMFCVKYRYSKPVCTLFVWYIIAVGWFNFLSSEEHFTFYLTTHITTSLQQAARLLSLFLFARVHAF
jgi:hypothetical protein